MSKSQYELIDTGKWFTLPDLMDFACCSCGLVHRIETRLKDGKVQLKMKRNGPATGGVRAAAARKA
jgi:hypothetical protein